jgi:hypothetical protein
MAARAKPRGGNHVSPPRGRAERRATLSGQIGGSSLCSTAARSSARATCFPHFLDQPREVSLGQLLQFIYWIVAVVDADLF